LFTELRWPHSGVVVVGTACKADGGWFGVPVPGRIWAVRVAVSKRSPSAACRFVLRMRLPSAARAPLAKRGIAHCRCMSCRVSGATDVFVDFPNRMSFR